MIIKVQIKAVVFVIILYVSFLMFPETSKSFQFGKLTASPMIQIQCGNPKLNSSCLVTEKSSSEDLTSEE